MKRDETKDGRTDISGSTDVDQREQDKLPPRGRARVGNGTHGDERKTPSTRERPKAKDVTREG